ncbi:MAG: mycofactocin system glycosyltransferase [Acidobacteria bacterium]|nr:mycofactocin system glycosyltransferase [Acidobacteriota bacterium]
MSELSILAPDPLDAPVASGTPVVMQDNSKIVDRDFIIGGSPWRVLRLAGGSAEVVKRWQEGGHVRVGEERFARTLVQRGIVRPVLHGPLVIDDIDVIIPVRDNIATLRALLTQLRGLHVTVVDDASRDPLLLNEIADNFGVSLIRLDVNLGPGGARNAGARATSRPLVCFVDADVEIDDARGVLQRLSAQFQDPLIGACAPRVVGAKGATLRDRFEERYSPLDLGPHEDLVMPGGDVNFVPSACLMVRRVAFGDGFDEALRLGEDVDLVWRLHDRGWLVRYHAAVCVQHRARTNWRTWFAQRVSYGSSAGALAERHGERLAPVRFDVWSLATWVSLSAGRPMIAARIASVVRRQIRSRVSESDQPDAVANEIVGRAMLTGGGAFARSLVRNFGPLLLLLAVKSRARGPALVICALGTAWRFRHQRPRPSDIALGILDDAAYCVGVTKGAIEHRSLQALTPRVIPSSLRLRDFFAGQGRLAP